MFAAEAGEFKLKAPPMMTIVAIAIVQILRIMVLPTSLRTQPRVSEFVPRAI